jgi:hypothetical protein
MTNDESNASIPESGGPSAQVSEAITKKLNQLFDIVIANRKKYYESAAHRKPIQSDIPHLIENCARSNAGISGAAAVVPGALGVLTIIPEIIAVTRNQLNLIYDIGVALGKEDIMSRELLLAVFASALGMSLGGLGMMHGSKVIIKRSSLRIMQRVIANLSGKITQQALKASVGRWYPVIGSATLATWSYQTTKIIGRKASKILEMDIEILD